MKKYKYLIYLISILTCFSSCDDFLDLEPEDGVTLQKYWNTKEEVKAAVMGCYAAMMNDKAMWLYFDWGENRAEMATRHPVNPTEYNWYMMQNGDISETNKYTEWASIYSVINNCNTILEFAKNTQMIDQSFSVDLLKEYEAEAVCVRSLMYFYLVRTFSDVPYIVKASVNDDQKFSEPKKPQAEILDSLVANLKRVDRSQNGTNKGIPFSYGSNPAVNKGRFTVWGLKALLADIYLWKEDYESCIAECNQIIGSDQYSLIPIARTVAELEIAPGSFKTVYYPSEGDAGAFFSSMYAQGNSVESIFELQFDTDYENPFWTHFNTSSGGVAPNTEYLKNYLFIPSSIDRGWYDIRAEGVSYRQSIIWKWIGLDRNDFSKQRAKGESFSNWIFYRLADVYLMKAEALAQLGRKTENEELLKESLAIVRAIRLRSTAPESTDLIPESEGSVIDADVLERFILEERAREFAFEGKRWFDVLRNAKRDNYRGLNYLMELAINAAQPAKVYILQNKWKGNYNSHYLPINDAELKSNSALVQNPFYVK